MTRGEYYAEERAYEARMEAMWDEYDRTHDEDGNEFEDEDEWQAHGFRDSADYWRWKEG